MEASMFNELKKMLSRSAVAGGLCIALTGLATADVVTVTFQEGSLGYDSCFDRYISDTGADDADGDTVATKYLDGYAKDSSPDVQYLIRFDDIIGEDANQIPTNATILDAKITLTTSLASNAHTGGPYGVAGLVAEFDSGTTYWDDFSSNTSMGSRGPWWQDESATRPVGGFGGQMKGQRDSAPITPLVQSWVDSENYGMVVQAGLSDDVDAPANTTDGWSIRTTGYPFSDSRPKLTVTYTTADIEINSFQEGTDGYAGTTMAIIHSGNNALIADADEDVNDGATFTEQTFLDGIMFSSIDGVTSSPDLLTLIKFDGIFGTDEGQAPTDVPVAKAWLVITTGNTSTACQTVGPFSAYTMLREWDMTSLHSSFGEVNGLQVGDGDISEALDTLDGFIRGAEVWFDVTDYVEGVRTGAADNGVAVQGDGTSDGWQIHTNGSDEVDARPRLVVYSGDLNS